MGVDPAWWKTQFDAEARQRDKIHHDLEYEATRLAEEFQVKMMQEFHLGLTQGFHGRLLTPSTPTPPPVREPASSSRIEFASRWSIKPKTRGWSWAIFITTIMFGVISVVYCLTRPFTGSLLDLLVTGNFIFWGLWGLSAANTLDHLPAARKKAMVDLGSPPEENPDHHHEGLFPSDYFTPYCVCPACGEEALHWMRPPAADEGASLAKCWDASINDAYVIDDALREKLRAYEIIRTCRTCEMSWGQNTTTSTSKEAVHVPRSTAEQEVDDAAGELAKINEDKPAPEPDSDPTWRPLKDVVGRPDSAVPAPIRHTVDPVEQWADAFMDGVAPERTIEEVQALNATAFNPSDIAGSVSRALESREANRTTEKPTADTPMPNRTPMPRPPGGELTQADAQAKVGKDRVKDYRDKGGKMHIIGPGGLVMAAKDPETGQWGVPNKRTTWVGTQRGTPTEITGATPKAIESEIIDAEEVELPKEDQ